MFYVFLVKYFFLVLFILVGNQPALCTVCRLCMSYSVNVSAFSLKCQSSFDWSVCLTLYYCCCCSFPALSCEFASVDVSDVLGTVSFGHLINIHYFMKCKFEH